MTPVADTRPLRHWLHRYSKSMAGGPHLVICCAEHPDPAAWSRSIAGPGPDHAVVHLATCVSQVPAAVLLELVAGGAAGITVTLDGCANPDETAVVVARAGSFLLALGRPETIACAKATPAERKRGAAWPIMGENAVPVSRRALFGRPDGLRLVEPSENPTDRLLAVLRELAEGDGPWTELDGIPTGVPRLAASRCAGSGACARSCPENALALTRTVLAEAGTGQEAMAQFQLTFDASRCTGCGQCLQICPESALQRAGEHLWSSLFAGTGVSLRVGLIRRCARCGSGHGRSGDLCAVCAFRAGNPFGSAMPPGLAALSGKSS
jgi:ferredoxin